MTFPRRRPATIIEVARRAGVSPSTVSRVINKSAAVVPETEQRVRQAIAEYAYSPHPAARQLVMQRTDTIGLLLPEISGAFFPPMLKGIEAGVREAGYDLLIHSTQGGHAHRPLAEHNTDGLLVFPGSIDEVELNRLYRLGFPVILLHQTPPANCSFPVVTVENKSGAKAIVQHLIEVHDRRRIIFLRGPDSHEDSLWRERGYREALLAHQIPIDEALIAYGGFDEQDAFFTIEELLANKLEFDAVFAGDDDAAVGVISALKQTGRNIPQDVAVVGFDDVPISRFIQPSLTTVRAPIEEVGWQAVKQLVNYIQKRPYDPEILLPTELIIRQSCGCN